MHSGDQGTAIAWLARQQAFGLIAVIGVVYIVVASTCILPQDTEDIRYQI